MKTILLSFLLFLTLHAGAQEMSYQDSMRIYQRQYVDSHGVVKDDDRKHINFYKPKKQFRVVARFERIYDSSGFIMKTSGTENKKYFKYGLLSFTLGNKPLHLTVYQSEKLMSDDKYKDYLFVPFTDETSGEKTYGGGRYLDFVMDDIKNNTLIIDFNKAYNPYCAYTTGFNCPIPPRENNLLVKVKAGEKNYGKDH